MYMRGYNGFNSCHGGFRFMNGGVGMFYLSILLIILTIVIIVLYVRKKNPSSNNLALEELKIRFVKNEITEEEFLSKRKTIIGSK